MSMNFLIVFSIYILRLEVVQRYIILYSVLFSMLTINYRIHININNKRMNLLIVRDISLTDNHIFCLRIVETNYIVFVFHNLEDDGCQLIM